MQTVIFSDVLYPGYGKNAGAYRIATELRKHGYTCQVVDYFSKYTFDEIISIIDKFVTKETLWVGFSNTFMIPSVLNEEEDMGNKDAHGEIFDKVFAKVSDFNSGFCFSIPMMRDIFDYIRRKNLKIKIIIGGARTDQSQRNDCNNLTKLYADFYVHGYADRSIVELTQWIESKENKKPLFNILDKCSINSTRDYDFHEFNTSNIKYTKEDLVSPDEYLPIEIARGCIFKCKFCNFALLGKKRGDYTKTKETLINEFMYNYETFGTTNYMFMDETTNDSMEKAEFLLDVTSSLPFKIRWGGYARLDLYYSNPEMANIMQETGLRHTFFGIETFNKKTGEVVGKGMHPDKVKSTLANLKSVWKDDVRITSGLIVGLPHETRESLKQLENYLLSDGCNLDSWVIHPLILANGVESMFGMNPGKYGYQFNDTWDLNWTNNDMNFKEAIEIAKHLRTVTEQKSKINSWTHMRLQNVGYTEKEVDNMNVRAFLNNLDVIKSRVMSKKDIYYNHLMSL
jgi:hypothetical protein